MYQGDQIVGDHSGPETMAAGSRQGMLMDTHGMGQGRPCKWMVPVPSFLTKPGAHEHVVEAIRKETC